MWSRTVGVVLAIAAGALSVWPLTVLAQSKPAPPKSARLYIFDCGVIKGLGVELFGFKPGEVPDRDFFVPCYLVVHPRGTLMWDVGVIPDSAFRGYGSPAKDGRSTVDEPLLPQLAAVGYQPADITYLALSHYHSDHTANANAFAGSTWLVHTAERETMFADKPAGIIQPASFSVLKTSKTKMLTDADYDVFGDGTVVIKHAPGHTPGHQVLFLKLRKFGPLLVAGDLYHYPEERTMNRFPTFEFDKEQSARSRAAIEAFVHKTKAQMWIEHDAATNAKLKKAPEYYE
ncbi:MAG TPA: N-acyl homoserine lactonase family protein [Vicinamibacterales bacterium]|jgi:N-acyl homoserine lactone hydrolase|nr:N-acyl homoserine lactonase family protein [Vicinamibacterales bacterium]